MGWFTKDTDQLAEYKKDLGEFEYQKGCRVVWDIQFGGKYFLYSTIYPDYAPFGSGYYELLLDGSIGPCFSYNYCSSD